MQSRYRYTVTLLPSREHPQRKPLNFYTEDAEQAQTVAALLHTAQGWFYDRTADDRRGYGRNDGRGSGHEFRRSGRCSMTDTDHGAYYDYGWNARMQGKPYICHNSRDWRDGWKDCDEALASGEVELGAMA